jgi:hypothetical protein
MIIKNFKIFEAQDRKYGGNVFSNNHRSPNLPSSCGMIDIDNISIVNDSINGIIEDKYKFESKFLGNPMSAGGTWQRTKLLDICKTLKCDLLFKETSTNTIYKFQGDNPVIKISSLDEYNLIDTSDRVYIEIRYGRPKAVMYRTEGLKIEKLNTDNVFNAALKLATSLQIRLYLVNDIIDNKIYIKKYFPILSKEISNTYLINPSDPKSWNDIYDRIGLL